MLYFLYKKSAYMLLHNTPKYKNLFIYGLAMR